MLLAQVKSFGKWDVAKIKIEFNCAKNQGTKFFEFDVVIGYNPHDPLDLIPLP